jgi:hypothetical protein
MSRDAMLRSTLSSARVHVGRREHYRLAAGLVRRRPHSVVLIQRSSTLVLGPECGWVHEGAFHDDVRASVDHGARWFHVTSLTGIERHLARRSSRFPCAGHTAPPVVIDGLGRLCVGSGSSLDVVKVLPGETGDSNDWLDRDDFKLDRQIRLIAADVGAHHEALVVSDLGDRQLTIHLDGAAATTLFEAGLDFYERCPPLHSADLDRVLASRAPLLGAAP